MPNGFLTIAKWFSLTVTILLDSATLSAGKYVFVHDKVSERSRFPPSLCHLRCAKDSNKVISVGECVRSCQRKLTSSLNIKHENRKAIEDESPIRQKRSFESKNECMNSQVHSMDEPRQVEILSVDFDAKEPDIKVVWKNMTYSKTGDFNWSAYALIYQIDCNRCRKGMASCKVVPKNQTDYLVPGDNWRYPDVFHAAVVTYPYNKDREITLKSFSPKVTPKIVPIPTEAEKDTVKLVGSILGGVAAGGVLLLFLYAGVKWRKRRPCPDNHLMPPPAPSREDNKETKELRYYTCYYPESDAFRERVASIVNYFRENGYNVIMDVMVSEEITSQGPTRWGESQIRKANKVLIFLSPGLVNLALDGGAESQSQDINRVWIELEVLRDLYTRNRSASKMVCITLPDMPVSSQALPLWAKVSYKWPDDALEILKRLNDRPKILPV